MEKPSGQGEQSRKSDEDLAKSIKKMISKSVKELIAECREKLKAIDSTDVSNPTASEPSQRQYQDADSSHIERKQKGRGIKNQVVGEKVVFFSLPGGFDAEHLDKVRERLGEWRIQRRKRVSKTKLTDTYYRHLCSSVTLRSVNEVAEYISSGSLPKKRKEVDHSSESSSSKKVRKNKAKLEALPDGIGKGENISAEVQALTSIESMGANILTMEANAQEGQVVKENSEKGDNMALSKSSKKHRKDEEKQLSTSQESSWSPSSESTIVSNMELSLVPWTPLDSEVNMYYWYLSPTQIQLNPQPLSVLPYKPLSSICQDKNKAILIHEKENFVDLTKDSEDENETYSNWEITEVAEDKVKSISSSEPPPLKNMMDNLLEVFDEYTNIMGNIRLVDLLGESNDNVVTPHSNQKDVGKENQALIVTDEAVESFTITESRNKKNQNLQENSGPAVKFATLEEAKEKLACVELEGVVDDDYHFQHGVHFSKPDPVNHLLDYDYDYYYDDVIDLLFRD